MLCKILFIWTLALMTQACAPLPTQPPPLAIPASLAEPCPPLRGLTDGTAGPALRWSIGTVEAYRDCQLKHRALVDAWPR